MVVESPSGRRLREVPAGQRPVRLARYDDGASALFRNRTASVPGVRALVRDLMDGYPSDVAATAEVVASEIASNAVRHTRGKLFILLVRHDGVRRVTRISVEDRGPRSTVPVFPADGVPTDPEQLMADGGRGLGMVARMCSAGHSAHPVPFSDRWVVEALVAWEGGGDDVA